MASRPFQFCKGERSQIKKSAAKHFEGLAALSARSAGRRAAVKAGYKTVHFSLDGCPLSCYFSGSVATLRDTLSTSRSVGRGTGLSYTCRRSLKPARFFVHSHSQKFSLFSCRSKRGAKSTAPRFPRQPRQQV